MTFAGRLRALVRERAGLEVAGSRGDLFDAALGRMARAAGLEPDAQARRILEGELPLAAFLEELAVGESWFFRDAAQWEHVERVVLPGARARRGGGPVRAWSAGCASGEEPYSLAILCEEGGVPAEIVGTDLSEAALARARRAEYSLWALRGDGAPRARRWLPERGGRFTVDPRVARQVRFFGLNLAEPTYPSPARGLADLDLVLCRNVLIYLDAARVAEVARRLFDCLAPGGWLLTAAADPPLTRLAPFERLGPHGSSYRRAERAPPPEDRPAPLADRVVLRAPEVSARLAAPARAPVPLPEECLDCRSLLDAGRLPEALAAVDAALARAPLRADFHLMRAVVQAERGDLSGAEEAARRAQYLAREEPFVAFFLGLVREQRGDRAGSSRGFRRALALAEPRPPEEVVPLSEGLTAGALAEAARHHLARLAGAGSGAPGR